MPALIFALRRQRALQRRVATYRRAPRIAPTCPRRQTFARRADAMVLVAALVTLAAAASAAAGADAVAAATTNADRSPETLLGDDTPVDLSGSTPG